MKKLIILFLLLSFCLFYTFSQQDQYEIISEQKIEYRDVNSVYYHSPTSVVSYQQVVEDIDNIKYLLKTCYAGYEDALARGLDLEKFEQNILSEFSNSIYDKNSISTDKICDVVYNELKNFIIDSHFTLYSLNSYYSLCIRNRILYSNIYVREKNGKYFVVESDIPEIKKKSEFTGSKENLFLYPAKGKNIYRIGFTKTVESSAENDYIETEIELSFNNENKNMLFLTNSSNLDTLTTDTMILVVMNLEVIDDNYAIFQSFLDSKKRNTDDKELLDYLDTAILKEGEGFVYFILAQDPSMLEREIYSFYY